VEAEVEITDQSPKTKKMFISNSTNGPIELEVRSCTLKSSIGRIYQNVPVPVDRLHYAALLRYYQNLKNWNRYFHLKNTFPDLRPRDAATVHKAQGSTYESVFIDVGNLSTCHLPNVVSRLLYVGFTRAKNRVILYGELNRKYGGVLV
jgi:exodeoxyribonuclease-5